MRAPDFWRNKNGGWLAALLTPLGLAYGLAARARFSATTPWKAPVPVLCVGNLVAGGAGKTPVALSLGELLAKTGMNIHFLTRGYGGKLGGPLCVDPDKHDAAQVGDEALLLARTAPTWISADRAAGVRLAAAGGAKVIVMDDGFQNPGLAKDVSLLVIDGGYGVGNGRVIPAGPLREPLAAGLARADALVMIGDDKTAILDKLGLDKPGQRILPVLKAHIIPGPEAGKFKDKDVVAFAGIGNPEKFFQMLRAIGARVVSSHPFPDHYPYDKEEIDRLRTLALATNSLLATTAKDEARLPASARKGIEVLTISIKWDDETALKSILGPLKAHGG